MSESDRTRRRLALAIPLFLAGLLAVAAVTDCSGVSAGPRAPADPSAEAVDPEELASASGIGFDAPCLEP